MSIVFSLILWNTFIAGVLAVVVKLAERTRWLRARPAVLHLLWIIVAFKLVTPPLIPVPILGEHVTHRSEFDNPIAEPATPPPIARPPADTDQIAATRNAPLQTTAALPVPTDAVGRSALTWLPYVVSVVWGIGTLVLLTALWRAAVAARRIVRLSQASGELTRQVAELSETIPGCRCPIVVVNARVSPALLGWSAPVVILPRRSLELLDDTELRAVIAHELAHYQRRDHWVTAFAALIRAAVWWNPIAWWAYREIRLAQELCCDSAVIGGNVATPKRYATALMKVVDLFESAARHRLAAAIELIPGPSPSVRALTRRMQMLAEQHRSQKMSLLGVAVLSSFAAAALCFPTIGRSQPKEEIPGTAQKNTARAKRAAEKEPAFDLHRVAATYQDTVNVSGGLVSGSAIVRRIEKNSIHFRSGDHITFDPFTKILGRSGNRLVELNSKVIKPGMLISYSIQLNRPTAAATKLIISGKVKDVPAQPTAWNQIKKLRLEKLGQTKSSLDGRFPIRMQSKTGPVEIQIGKTKLIELPQATKMAQWQQGKFRPESVEDFDRFEFVLIEWLKNGRFTATCYRRPKK